MIRLSCAAMAIAMVLTSASAEASASLSTQVVHANTSYVEDITILKTDKSARIFAATRGGVEAYESGGTTRVAHYTTADGLPSLHIRKVFVEDERLVALTREHRCELVADRFECAKTEAMANTPFTVAGRMGGARITKKVRDGDQTLIATAGAGLWLAGKTPKRLTPVNQICSNHMMAITAFAGRTYFGSFDEGLCSTKDGLTFTAHEGDFRMVNDLEATSEGLFVASSEGLFRSKDGETFEKIKVVKQRGVNGLAFDGRSLWVTTPGALWRVRIKGGPPHREFWLPGGARSLQAVAERDGQVWVASEDRGLLKMKGLKFEVFDRAAGMPASWTLDVAIDAKGKAFGATLRDGIVSVSKKGQIEQVSGAPDEWTLFVDVDRHGVSMGTQGGAALVKKGATSTMLSLPHPNVHVMARVGPELFVGTEGGTVVIRN